MSAKTIPITGFRGLDNVADPTRLKPGWLRVAENIDIGMHGVVSRRPGYTLALPGALSAGYATHGGERLYVVDSGDLKQVLPGMSAVTLASGLDSAPMHWAEVNQDTYFSNGPDKGIITPSGELLVWDWPIPTAPRVTVGSGRLAPGQYGVACTYTLADGRETGASEPVYVSLTAPGGLLIEAIPQAPGLRTNTYIAPADSTVFQQAASSAATAITWNLGPEALGEELLTQGMEPPPPEATILALWRGRLWLSQYLPDSDTSVVWSSEALGFHLFNLAASFLQVPGKIVMLLAHNAALIVGTCDGIHAWDGERLALLADYGVAPGRPGTQDDESGECYFWTQRGLCKALPFQNLTAGRLHVAPGLQACTSVVHAGGHKKLITTVRTGGNTFNPRTTP